MAKYVTLGVSHELVDESDSSLRSHSTCAFLVWEEGIVLVEGALWELFAAN